MTTIPSGLVGIKGGYYMCALIKVKGCSQYVGDIDSVKIILTNNKDEAMSVSKEFAESFTESNDYYVAVKEKGDE